ncbi:cytochrome P450 [Leptolyngbya sp. 'hensonii']|uniref:cytochrome P450 n=1 Tax=Leptolyngbya sp. 'hensonii' TaxID=1922337 RepID=UPI00094FD97D|nr:cytochrome P450 [Leptolyngbya sp. 'hensonii']OLP18131.1 cytochrome P450 [Leptolyngbya sp. 'hensonii']
MSSQTETPPTPIRKPLPRAADGSKLLKTLGIILWPVKRLEALAHQYGDIFVDEFHGFPPLVVISNPKAIQEIFTADPKKFESGSANQVLLPFVGTDSLFLLDGDRHLQRRKLLTPPFHGERMRAYGQLIGQITDQVIDKWSLKHPFAVHSSMQAISLRVILRAVFGLQEGERFEQISAILSAMMNAFTSPVTTSALFFRGLQQDWGAWSPWGRFLRQREQLDRLLYQEIHDRRQGTIPPGDDILSLMMAVQDEAGQGMTDKELRDELMTLLIAGQETTANSLTWALGWIHYLPDVRERLMQELATIDLDQAEPMDIAQLPYLSAVCQETLRIVPIAFFTFSRVLQVPMQLLDYDLPAGTVLSVCIYLTHHRPDLYPEPNQFRPERFLERQFSPYEFLPFGGSSRRCIGMAFALFEMKLALAKILSRYSLKSVEKKPPQAARRGLTFAPAGGTRLVVTADRKQA